MGVAVRVGVAVVVLGVPLPAGGVIVVVDVVVVVAVVAVEVTVVAVVEGVTGVVVVVTVTLLVTEGVIGVLVAGVTGVFVAGVTGVVGAFTVRVPFVVPKGVISSPGSRASAGKPGRGTSVSAGVPPATPVHEIVKMLQGDPQFAGEGNTPVTRTVPPALLITGPGKKLHPPPADVTEFTVAFVLSKPIVMS